MKKRETEQSVNVRQKLESVRASFIAKHGEKKARNLFYAAMTLAGLLLLLLLLSIFLPIRSFSVTGDLSMYNESVIISASELEEGDSLFWSSSWSIKKNIKKNLPLCSDVKVKKTISGRVSIEVDFADVVFYAKLDDGVCCALDQDLRVLDIDKTTAKYAANGGIKLLLPPVRDPVLGEPLVFYDTVEETDTEGETLYEVKKESYYAYVTEFLNALSHSQLLNDSFGIDLRERFDIRLAYGERFIAHFGNAHDTGLKFKLFLAISQDTELLPDVPISVDLSDVERPPTARVDYSIDFEPYR